MKLTDLGSANMFPERRWIVRSALHLLVALAGLAACAISLADTLERTRATGTIRVGFANEAPYAYLDAAGQLTGESPTVFRHVMKALGVGTVEGVLTEWGSLIPGLKAGRFDAIVASMYITPKRCRQILFANPTYGVGESLIVRTGNPTSVLGYEDIVKQGAAVAVIAGTAEQAHARLAGVARSRTLVVPDFAAGVAAVKSGRAAALAITELTAKDLAGKDNGIESTTPFIFEHAGKRYRGEGAFGFRQDDKRLRDAVNVELARYLGSEAHLAAIRPFGFDRGNLPLGSAAELCAER